MDAATVAQLGSGEPTVMHGEADTVQATKQGVGETGVVRKLLTVCLCGFCPGRLV